MCESKHLFCAFCGAGVEFGMPVCVIGPVKPRMHIVSLLPLHTTVLCPVVEARHCNKGHLSATVSAVAVCVRGCCIGHV